MSKSIHASAILQALLVTFLWSTSWVLIKQGLHEIPALTFAGLRYMLAFAILLPSLWRHRDEVRALGARQWVGLISLGVVFYTLTQGGQFLVLKYLEATTFSLLLSFTPVLVALVGTLALKEIPSRLQWVGMAVFLTGAVLYFSPISTMQGSTLGFVLAAMTLLANGASAILGRFVNRENMASPIVVTGIGMGVGAFCLFAIGVGTQGLPSLSPAGWGIVIWLAVVNTALAFTLWNRTLRVLSAVQSSIINSTMLIQIAVLAWLFLGETHSALSIVGLLVAAVGIILVQMQRR